MSRRRVSSLLALALTAALWTAPVLRAAELEVSARLQPELIGVDELAHLSIEVRGAGFGGRSFEPLFEMENFEVASGPSTDQRFQYINGAASRSLTLTWVLRPLAVGPARVHSIEVRVGDDVFELPDAAITVQEDAVGRVQPGGRRRGDPFDRFFPDFSPRGRRAASPRRVFLRAELSPEDPYVGQQALYTLYLFTQVNVSSISPEVLPDFEGLWVRELPQPGESELEMVDIDGQQFGRVPILRRAVFPIRAGQIELGPAKVQLSVRMPDRTFGSMFSQTEQVRRDSNAVRLTARALPTPAPAGFAGAVGDLKVAAELEPQRVALGDAATYSLTLSGAGHLQGLPTPELPRIPGLRVFPPEQENDERFVGRQVHGRRTWSWVLVPEQAGGYELPAVEMSYFDPAGESFAVARAAAIALEVTPPEDEPEPAVPEAAAPVEAAVDDRAPPEIDGAAFDWSRVLPWALVVTLLLALVVLLVRRRPGGDRAPLQALDAALALASTKEKPREAAALIEDGWRSFLEARWSIPPGTPSTQWARRLEETGAPAAAAESLVALADDLHYLRYAPQLSDTDALKRELIVRSTKLSRTLK